MGGGLVEEFDAAGVGLHEEALCNVMGEGVGGGVCNMMGEGGGVG